jgi:hypothetical protein
LSFCASSSRSERGRALAALNNSVALILANLTPSRRFTSPLHFTRYP